MLVIDPVVQVLGDADVDRPTELDKLRGTEEPTQEWLCIIEYTFYSVCDRLIIRTQR